MSISFEFQNGELVALQQSMRTASGRVSDEVRDAVTKAGKRVADTARPLAPKETGRLRGSITSTTSGSSTEFKAEIGPTVRYGEYQEHGTSKMNAHPFLGPALEAQSDSIADDIAEAAAKAMQL